MTNKNKAKTIVIIKSIIMGILACVMLVPVVWMMSTSLKYESDVFSFPIEWIPSEITWSNYTSAFTKFPYINWYMNTFRNTILIVLSILIISSMAGYAFAKLRFRGSKVLFLAYVAALMVPSEVRLIPQFLLYRNLGLINTMWSVVLPWMLFVGFAIFLMRQAFMGVPNELLEAAQIDGCNYYQQYYKIALPLIKSSLITLGILAFTWGWNDYTGPMIYINDLDKQVLSVGIAAFKTQYSSNFALQMAGATVALVPIIIVYLIAQKYLIEGVAASGIKG